MSETPKLMSDDEIEDALYDLADCVRNSTDDLAGARAAARADELDAAIIANFRLSRQLLAEKDAEIAALRRASVRTFVAVLIACGGRVDVPWSVIENLPPDAGFTMDDDRRRGVRIYGVSK